ncbi:hypothetical protein TELCIR_26076, partial [Teladorsagia circumcincta]
LREKRERAAAKKRAEEAAMERRRSRRSLAVVNREPEGEDEEPIQHQHTEERRNSHDTEASMSTEVRMYVNIQAAGDGVIAHSGEAGVLTIKEEPMEAGIPTDEAPLAQRGVLVEDAVAEVVSAKDNLVPPDEVFPTITSGSTENSAASSTEAPKSSEMEVDVVLQPPMDIEMVESAIECVQTEKENQHSGEGTTNL